VPLFYCFLKSKSVETYLAVFQSFANCMPNGWQPRHCMADFEKSALVAFNQIFRRTRQNCCNFHLGQSICRKIRELPTLRQFYLADPNIRTKLRTLQALAFVRPNVVYTYFLTTMSEIIALCNAEIETNSMVQFFLC